MLAIRWMMVMMLCRMISAELGVAARETIARLPPRLGAAPAPLLSDTDVPEMAGGMSVRGCEDSIGVKGDRAAVGVIAGRVTDREWRPVIGARIRVAGTAIMAYSQTPDGWYHLEDLPVGPCLLEIIVDGHPMWRAIVVVTGGERQSCPLTLVELRLELCGSPITRIWCPLDVAMANAGRRVSDAAWLSEVVAANPSIHYHTSEGAMR